MQGEASLIQPEQRLEDFFRSRYEKDAIYLPSGRFGLYLAFREWLRPGQRLLLSPINDDVVFFTVLAAGLIPVLGPVDSRTGNLDAVSVDQATWRNVNAVMTSNLYGIPDQMRCLVEVCQRHNLLLIEDACQALESHFDEQRIGEFSSVAVFSLTKHIEGIGGVLAFSETERRPSLLSRVRAESVQRTLPALLGDVFRRIVRSVAEATGTLETLRRERRRFFPPKKERPLHRMEYVLEQVLEAGRSGPSLEHFERWVGIDNTEYRTIPRYCDVSGTLEHLQRLDENRTQRIDGTRRLLDLDLTPPDVRVPENTALFRVPLFIRNRDDVVRQFAWRGISLDYIYDPPLDVYAPPSLAERIASPVEAERWSRDVLPVDPLHASRFLDLLAERSIPVSAVPEITSSGSLER